MKTDRRINDLEIVCIVLEVTRAVKKILLKHDIPLDINKTLEIEDVEGNLYLKVKDS